MKSEVVFADTNLFLRFLTNDVPDQAKAVQQLLLQAAQGEVSLITTSLVIAEIVWTLESFYKETKENIQQLILSFLNTPGLNVDNGDLIVTALRWYVDKNIDFIDAYNAAWMEIHEITSIYTFDQNHFDRLEGVTVITPGS
jgi:predicted nucleic-acid-binding protein